MRTVLAALSATLSAAAASQMAALGATFFYASSPTHANETLLLLGGPGPAMLNTTFVRLCDLGGACALLPNVQRTDASAKVVLPAAAPLGAFTVAACAGADGADCAPPAARVVVNAPAVQWQQADAGLRAASPGGWVRAFGTALAFAAGRCVPTAAGAAPTAARAQLVPAAGGGAPIALPVSFASCYAITADVPADAPAGDFFLQVSNGLPGAGWANASARPTTVAPRAPWPTTVFNVQALGVFPALAAAAANGGGVVFFPRGRYAFDENHTLNAVPPRTALVGEGTDLVELYWRDMAAPPTLRGAVTALVQGAGGGPFAVRNLTLYVQGNFTTPVIGDGGADGLEVAGVIVRANPYYMTLEPVNQTFHGRSMPVGSGFNSGAAVQVQGCNWRIVDSDLLGGSHAVSVFTDDAASPTWFSRPCNGVIARNRLVGGWGMYRLEGADGVIIEDNIMSGGGMNAFGSWISTYYAKATSGVYFARNAVSSVMGGDRELLSMDGGGGAYLGAVESAAGTALRLAADPVFAGYIPPGPRLFNYTEACVVVLDGAGKGQVARVAANAWAPGGDNRSWTIDAPFAVPLDATSVVSIVPFRGDMVVAGNAFVDGGAIQLYAMAIRVVVADNTAARTSGFKTWGLNPHGWGVQPNFMTSFLDNEVSVGNAWGGQSGGFESVSPIDNTTYNRAVVFRRNAVLSNAPIAVGGATVDVVVEACHVAANDVGIAVSNATTAGVWLRGNTFDGVAAPLAAFISYAPGLHCCCNATDAATGVAVVVKPAASYTACTAGDCEAPGAPDPW
jgi:hypothetical protein